MYSILAHPESTQDCYLFNAGPFDTIDEAVKYAIVYIQGDDFNIITIHDWKAVEK